MDVTINTRQLKVLQDFFNDLSKADQKKIFISSFRKAAKPLVTAAKANVPYNTGQLMRSIGTIELKDEVAITVGAKLSGGGKKSGWYGGIMEGGTVERFRRKKKNAPTGRVAGTHWFERAYNATEEQIFNKIDEEWYNEIDRYIQRVNRKLKT